MKQITLILFAMLFTGCGTMVENHYAKMSTAALQLERQQIMFRVSTGDTSDIDRKEAIERELLRRGQMPRYEPVPKVQYGAPEEQS
jgi:hypothetical protein